VGAETGERRHGRPVQNKELDERGSDHHGAEHDGGDAGKERNDE
jgi:hypothetical protein